MHVRAYFSILRSNLFLVSRFCYSVVMPFAVFFCRGAKHLMHFCNLISFYERLTFIFLFVIVHSNSFGQWNLVSPLIRIAIRTKSEVEIKSNGEKKNVFDGLLSTIKANAD